MGVPDAISKNDVYTAVSSVVRSAWVFIKASDRKPRLMRPGFLMRMFVSYTAVAMFVNDCENEVRTLKTKAMLFVIT